MDNFTVLAPGIILYKTNKELCDEIRKRVESSLIQAWNKAGVVNTDTYESEFTNDSRRCFDYPLTKGSHNSDELNNLYDLVDSWISPSFNHFVAHYNIERLTPGPYILLKYGKSDKFDWHIDDGGKFPRTVSVSAYLNDDYDGGELEFNHFGISHKPEKGDIIFFNSSFTYMHRVKPVIDGMRYAVVNWYRYSTYPEVIGG